MDSETSVSVPGFRNNEYNGAKTFPSKYVHTKVRHLDIVFVIKNVKFFYR